MGDIGTFMQGHGARAEPDFDGKGMSLYLTFWSTTTRASKIISMCVYIT